MDFPFFYLSKRFCRDLFSFLKLKTNVFCYVESDYNIKYLCVSLTNRILICRYILAVFRQSATHMVKDIQYSILHSIKISGSASSVATKLQRLALCAFIALVERVSRLVNFFYQNYRSVVMI